MKKNKKFAFEVFTELSHRMNGAGKDSQTTFTKNHVKYALLSTILKEAAKVAIVFDKYVMVNSPRAYIDFMIFDILTKEERARILFCHSEQNKDCILVELNTLSAEPVKEWRGMAKQSINDYMLNVIVKGNPFIGSELVK